MRKCITCEGILDESHFSGNSPVCQMCVSRLNGEYEVEYSLPDRQTIKEATVKLILAIKEQAEHDEKKSRWVSEDKKYGGPIAAWRFNWVESMPWRKFWDLMLVEESVRITMRSAANKYVGRYH